MLEFIIGVAGFALNSIMMIILFLINVVFLMFVGGIAKSKGRNVIGWIIVGAFSPFLALIALLILTRKYPKTNKEFDDIPELGTYNPLVVAAVGIFGYVSSADGRVDENEYNAVYLHLKKSYGMSKRDLAGYREIIDYTKEHPEMIGRYTAVINKYTKPENKAYDNIRFLAMLCNVVALNGIEATEIMALKTVMEGLGMTMDHMSPLSEEMRNQGASDEHVALLVENIETGYNL